MNTRKFFTGFLASSAMLILILDSKCALESAGQALNLCIKSVIPSLFPFLFLSSLITGSMWGYSGKPIRFVAGMLRIPVGAESLIVPGFLGGYPAGAQAIGENYKNGRLKKEEAQRLLTFCCNAGPAFLFGMIAPQFPEPWMAWGLWIIHMASAGMVSAVFGIRTSFQTNLVKKTVSVSDSVSQTVRIMGIICGWIILFRILLGFLDKWFLWLLPEAAQISLWGFLELSNGCCSLAGIDDIAMRFILCSGMLSFGGLCVVMQTACVIPGLSISSYLRGKLLQTGFSILLSALLVYGHGMTALLICVCFCMIPHIHKKRSSILELSGV